MKSWKEHPQLFANGKFSIKFGVTTCRLYGTFNGYCTTTDWGNIHPNECTLIARPISSVSDEEKNEYEKRGVYSALYHNGKKVKKTGISKHLSHFFICYQSACYLKASKLKT